MSSPDLSHLRIDRDARRPARRRLLRWIGAALLLAIAGVIGVWRLAGAPAAVETVTVGTAYPYQALTLINATGYVVAQRKAAVASKATGRLEWLGVQEGSAVRRDEVIARLENRDVRAQADQLRAQVAVARAGIGQAQAELTEADAGLRRAEDLVARGFVSRSALDAAQARRDKARAAVAAAQAATLAAEAAARAAEVAVEQTLIRAPFDGVVLTKAANVGDIVTPFSSALDTKGAVVTMADMATLEIEADVSESNLEKIAVGQPCEVQLDAFPERRFRGEVSRLVPTVDRAKASVLAKIRLVDRDPRILPEMSAKVAFLSRPAGEAMRRPVMVVNPAAIAERDGRSVLFKVADGRASAVPVRAGERIGDTVAIDASGGAVASGDRVVLRPSAGLGDGARVRPAQK